MKLITETIHDIKILKEQDTKDPTKHSYYARNLMQGDIVNQNGRRYPICTFKKKLTDIQLITL